MPSGTSSEHNENINLVFKIMVVIGVNLFDKNGSAMKRTFQMVQSLGFYLFSVYYIILTVFHVYHRGLFDFHLLMSTLQFFLAFIIQLVFKFKGEDILTSCNDLIEMQKMFCDKPKKSLKPFLFLAVALNFATFMLVTYSSSTFETDSNYSDLKFLYFNYLPSNLYLRIVGVCLGLIRNWMEFMVTGSSLLLVYVIYFETGCLITGMKAKIEDSFRELDLSLNDMKKCASFVSKASNTVSKVDRAFSTLVFFLISLFVIQGMVLVILVTETQPHFFVLLTAAYLAICSILGMLILVVLSSRIPDAFSEIKLIVSTSASMRERIFQGQYDSSRFLELSQILTALESSFQMTALEFLKVDKVLMMTILCAIMSYGVVLFQMIKVDQTTPPE